MATLLVGSGQTFTTIASAVAASKDGDTILVAAGTYTNDFFTITDKITLKSVGGLAIIDATVQPGNGKAAVVVDNDAVIDGFGFTGVTVPDGNGAGIRYEAGNLVINHSLFWNNQDGLLAAANPTGTILIENSEFRNNGAGDGQTHNIYVNAVAQLTILDSYFHDVNVGHEIKSRALNTTIIGNRIEDGATSTASYSIDLPNGGNAVIENNVIEKGPDAENGNTIAYGEEGNLHAGSSLVISGNMVVNDRYSATLLMNQSSVTATVSYNTVYGYSSGQMAQGAATVYGTATLASNPGIDTVPEVAVTNPVAPATAYALPDFVASYYLSQNVSVAAGSSALLDYETTGWQKGLNPDAWFDASFYLQQNPDVAAAGMDPLLHFETWGWKEGRAPSLVFDDAKYLAANPDVAAAGMEPLEHYIEYGQHEGRATFLSGGSAAADPLIDPAYYDPQLGATLIPTGTAAAQQAAYSYDTSGWLLGLNPDAWFNASYYLTHNPDVAAAHMNPLLHYETYGWKEGRDPSALFSTSKYLAANPDVAAAGMDPLLHYVEYGQYEGRAIYAAG